MLTFNCVIFAENNHNEIDLDLQKHLLLFVYKNMHIPTACLAYYLTCICIFGALKFEPIIKSSYH